MSQAAELLKKINHWQGRAEELQIRLTDLRAELDKTIPAIVDAEGADRVELIERRAQILAEINLIEDERGEVVKRIKMAKLALLEFTEANAKSELERAAGLLSDGRKKLNAFLDKRMHGYSIRRVPTAENLSERKAVEVAIAEQQVDNQFLQKQTEDARRIFEAARAATDQARREMAI